MYKCAYAYCLCVCVCVCVHTMYVCVLCIYVLMHVFVRENGKKSLRLIAIIPPPPPPTLQNGFTPLHQGVGGESVS